MDLEYAKFSSRSLIILFFSVIIILGGYFYLSHIGALRGEFSRLEGLYNSTRSRAQCQTRGHQTLIGCFKGEFYKVARESNPYTRTYLSELFLEIYQRDLVLAHTPRQKASLKLEFIEQSYAFLLLIQTFKINRQNLQVGALLLAKLRTEYILNIYHSLNLVCDDLLQNEPLLEQLSPVERNRLKMVDSRRKELIAEQLNKTF
jgi:hypothetical protein